MSADEDWTTHQRVENLCTVHTTMWCIDDVYGVVEEYQNPYRCIANIKLGRPNQAPNSIIGWTMFSTLGEAKAWCIAELVKRRILS